MRKFQAASAASGPALGIFVAGALWVLCAALAHAQGRAPQQQGQSAGDAAPGVEKVGDGDDENRGRPRAGDPSAVLRTARVVYVRSLTAFVSEREVEASLLKRKEFRAWGMSVTRDEAQADLVIEITRKPLTRRFTFTVVEPRAMSVVAGGKTRSILFGKKIPNKIAEKFTNRLRLVRPY